jgi:nicotinamide mononucleotide transporter
MDIIKIIEMFALVTGVPYIVLEILQKNSMWYFGIATGLACAYSFAVQHAWSNMVLNVYYVAMSFWGFYRWKKDSGALDESSSGQEAEVHLSRLSVATASWSAVIFIAGTVALVCLLRALGGSSTWLDTASTMMSVVGTYWLATSIPYHWIIWLVADSILTVMCFLGGQYWLALLYLAYVVSAGYGLFHWLRKGAYVEEC